MTQTSQKKRHWPRWAWPFIGLLQRLALECLRSDLVFSPGANERGLSVSQSRLAARCLKLLMGVGASKSLAAYAPRPRRCT